MMTIGAHSSRRGTVSHARSFASIARRYLRTEPCPTPVANMQCVSCKPPRGHGAMIQIGWIGQRKGPAHGTGPRSRETYYLVGAGALGAGGACGLTVMSICFDGPLAVCGLVWN